MVNLIIWTFTLTTNIFHMLTTSNYLSVQATVTKNLSQYLPSMIAYKSSIQRDAISLATSQEISDIAACRLNLSLVDKLVNLGKKHYVLSDKSDTTLYCIMAIGTIIKEYDWGYEYIEQSGMLDLTAKIAS